MRELSVNEVGFVSGGVIGAPPGPYLSSGAGGRSRFWSYLGRAADAIAVATAAAWAADQVPTGSGNDYDGNTSGSGQSTNPNAFGP
jgi:hypothetical protein